MKRNLLSLLLALGLCLSCALPAFAAEGDFKIEDGVLERYTGTATDVTIPAGVTAIGNWAFTGTGVTRVVIPEGVTAIQDGYAQPDDTCGTFLGCLELTEVVLPSTLTYIGCFAFWGCEKLTDITIPATVLTMDGAFLGSEFTEHPTTIHGVAGSCAEVCAQAEGLPFVADQTGTLPQVAFASTQMVKVDGETVRFNAYALRDERGYMTNYIKLRDVAALLSETPAKFQVTWDGAIVVTTGETYTRDGSEGKNSFLGNQPYTVPNAAVKVNGAETALEAILLTDGNGGGHTYFKLRDLGQVLGFTVDWDGTEGIVLIGTQG